MELQSISQISKLMRVSTRTLRYYEEIGLLSSRKLDTYAYRTYDRDAVRRLRQIIFLRKLRIPLKQIGEILDHEDSTQALIVFQNNIEEINSEITALSTIRNILEELIKRISPHTKKTTGLDLIDDDTVLEIQKIFLVNKAKLKEDHSMEELNLADMVLNKLKEARILFLPPLTVAAYRSFGKNPEDLALKEISTFIHTIKLYLLKPDLRMFGFNNPGEPDRDGNYGYEFWVTIPENLEVPPPLLKKHFIGGLYGAHWIKMGNFQEWRMLSDWLECHTEYELDEREPAGMGGCLEEHLNVYQQFINPDGGEPQFSQLDLLIPIRKIP